MNHHSEHSQTGSAVSRLVLALSVPFWAANAAAVEYGPFTLNGFVKLEASRASNQCGDCQRYPTEDKQRVWADELVPGKAYNTQSKRFA